MSQRRPPDEVAFVTRRFYQKTGWAFLVAAVGTSVAALQARDFGGSSRFSMFALLAATVFFASSTVFFVAYLIATNRTNRAP
jgi:hypothetical protein